MAEEYGEKDQNIFPETNPKNIVPDAMRKVLLRLHSNIPVENRGEEAVIDSAETADNMGVLRYDSSDKDGKDRIGWFMVDIGRALIDLQGIAVERNFSDFEKLDKLCRMYHRLQYLPKDEAERQEWAEEFGTRYKVETTVFQYEPDIELTQQKVIPTKDFHFLEPATVRKTIRDTQTGDALHIDIMATHYAKVKGHKELNNLPLPLIEEVLRTKLSKRKGDHRGYNYSVTALDVLLNELRTTAQAPYFNLTLEDNDGNEVFSLRGKEVKKRGKDSLIIAPSIIDPEERDHYVQEISLKNGTNEEPMITLGRDILRMGIKPEYDVKKRNHTSLKISANGSTSYASK